MSRVALCMPSSDGGAGWVGQVHRGVHCSWVATEKGGAFGLAPLGTCSVGLREGQESWESLPPPARQQSLTAAGLNWMGGVGKCTMRCLRAEPLVRGMEHLGWLL